MDKANARHDKKLEDLVNNLHLIGEDIESIVWLFKDGNFYKPNTCNQRKCCDIIAGYNDYSVLLAELKGSKAKRDKAILQLQSSEDLINKYFRDYYVGSKKIVYYGNGKRFDYESLPWLW